jgi:sulfur carrier protein
MRVFINGVAAETDALTLAELCRKQGFGEGRFATAVNGEFVAAAVRREQQLKDGDRIEIVAPRQGG